MRNVAVASAPGKIHLIGEHSSVYGAPAILIAISKRISVKLTRTSGRSFPVREKKLYQALFAIQKFLKQNYGIPVERLLIEVAGDLLVGRGMGSSAAISAAMAGALFELHKLPVGIDEIFSAAYEGEKVFHGNPSGGDLAACVYGGVIYFRKETEQIKLVKKIAMSSKIPSKFIVIDTGKPSESTKEMVAFVGEKMKKNPKLILQFVKDQENLTKKMADSLISGDVKEFEKGLSEAQVNLEKTGVVGKNARGIIAKLKKQGFAAKISGGGGIKTGSGVIVTGFTKDKEVLGYCKKNTWKNFALKIVKDGVRIENYE